MDEKQTLSDYAAGEIRAILARRRSTGKELAAQLEVSRSWVSYRLTGTTEITLNDLERIADALDVEITALLPTTTRTGGSKPIGPSLSAARSATGAARKAHPRPGHATPTLAKPPIINSAKRPGGTIAATPGNRRPVRISDPAAGGVRQ